jgi:hypothetical protein
MRESRTASLSVLECSVIEAGAMSPVSARRQARPASVPVACHSACAALSAALRNADHLQSPSRQKPGPSCSEAPYEPIQRVTMLSQCKFQFKHLPDMKFMSL